MNEPVHEELIVLELEETTMAERILTRIETDEDGERHVTIVLADELGAALGWAVLSVKDIQDLLKITINQGEN